MYQIAIVDDDARDAALLRSLLCRYAEESGCGEMRITCSEDGAAFLRGFTPAYDIVFFDIDMPGINGIEAAKKLREVAPDIAIVFVTNMAHYALEGYAVNAVDFMVKPLTYYAFALKFKKILRYVARNASKRIPLRLSEGETVHVDSADILYVEVMQHYLVYHMKDGENYRGCGYAKFMLNCLIHVAEKDFSGKNVVLSVYEENFAALNLYNLMGFIPYVSDYDSRGCGRNNREKYFKMIKYV